MSVEFSSVEFASVEFTVEDHPNPPRITDFENCLMLVRPLRVMPWRHPDGNVTDAVRADVVVLDDEESPPETLRGLTVIQSGLVRALKRRLGCAPPGTPVTTLARLSRIPSKRNPQHLVWVFEKPTEDDVALARDYLDEVGDPFAPASAA